MTKTGGYLGLFGASFGKAQPSGKGERGMADKQLKSVIAAASLLGIGEDK